MKKSENKYEFINCNICESNNTNTLFQDEQTNIVQCKNCGLIYRNPRLSEKEFKKTLDYPPIAISEDVYLSKKELFSNLLKNIEKIKKKGKMLDVGCGTGYFLKIARDSGWDASGTEINPYLIKFARDKFGIIIEQKTVKEFNSKEFDVVSLLEVLDQFRDPKGELIEIERILKKDGILVIRVYNGLWHCNLEKLRKIFSVFGLLPLIFHLYSFTPKTISTLLQKVGFKNIRIYNSEFTKGDPYRTGGKLGKGFVSFSKFFMCNILQFVYFISFEKICLSPSIIVYARKD